MTITIQDTSSTTTSGQGGQSIVTGTPTTGSFQEWGQFTASGYIGIGFSLMISGTWTGTLTFEASIDNGVTFVPYDVLLVGTGTVLNSVTSNCVVKGNLIDITHLRVRATAAMTGAATAILTALNDADFRHSATNNTGGTTSTNITQIGGNAIVTGGVNGSQGVGGLAASGSTLSGNPVLVAGSDGTDARTIATDSSGNQHISGDVAALASDSGNPVKIGGVAFTSSFPTEAANGQRVSGLFDGYGRQIVTISNQNSNSGTFANCVTPSDAMATQAALATQSQSALYNGSTWDRQRNINDIALLTSAARTVTTASSDQTNYNGRGVRVIISITANSSTIGLTPAIQGKDSISGAYYQINANYSAIGATGATGIFIYDIYPGLGSATGAITAETNSILSRTWRVNIVAGDSGSVTYSVSAVTLL